MRNLDFSSWQAVITTLLGLVVVTVLMVGIRLLVMETVQQRRNRENRQINERLRTLIAAYKTLGGSFTGELAVDPTHLRDLLASAGGGVTEAVEDILASVSFDRSRRIRDAVEGALSDVILLGTEQQVLLAVRAATDLVASATESYELALGRYRAGAGTVADLMNAQSALASANLQRIQARYRWNVAKVTLAKAVGTLDMTLFTDVRHAGEPYSGKTKP